MKILVAEDEKKVVRFILEALKQGGNSVDCVAQCSELLAVLQTTAYDILILDRMLGSYDTLDIIPMIRKNNPALKILVLSAIHDLESRVKGLTEGADDYLGKPFHVSELLARVKALSRRSVESHKREKDNLITFENIRVDLEKQVVWRKDKKVDLTRKEFQIFILLLKSPGKVFSKAEILDRVWEMNRDPGSNVVEVTIANLRAKIEKGSPTLIHSQRGVGYWIGER